MTYSSSLGNHCCRMYPIFLLRKLHAHLHNWASCMQKSQSTYRVEIKYGECICPLSWSVHCNFWTWWKIGCPLFGVVYLLCRPLNELCRPLNELCRTLNELCCTIKSYDAPYWALPHTQWAMPHPQWAMPHPYELCRTLMGFAAPSMSMPCTPVRIFQRWLPSQGTKSCTVFSNFDVQIHLSTNVIGRAKSKRVCQLISVEKMHLLRKGSRWICRLLFSPHLSEQQYTW
jgi:hypothetical protein